MQRTLAELLSREVKDPRIGPLTVTLVTAARDLSTAKVHVVAFGGAKAPPEMLTGLAAAAGFLSGEVGRRVGLRHAPRLEFVIDDTFERAAKLTALITAAVKGEA